MKAQRRFPLTEALFGGLYFFLIMFGYYMLKPLRDSSFLSEFHPNVKPLFNLVTMLILFGVAGAYNSVVKRIQGLRFIQAFYGFILLNLVAFWFAFRIYPAFTGALFYTWLSTANVFLVTVFWTQINSSFTGHKDKLFYVLIGLGGGIGAAFGGSFTSKIVPLIGSNNLIFTGGTVLLLAAMCAIYIARSMEKEVFFIPHQEKERANFKGLFQEEYAVCILALVIIGTFVQTIYDFQLSTLVAKTIGREKDALSVFYGSLYFRQNAFAFLAQLIIGPLILASIGPARGLYLFLFLILGSAAALTMNNSLYVMEWVTIIFAGSGYSIVQIFREQLYVPASQAVKVSFKGFIDTFGFRAGDAFAAVATVLLVGVLGMDVVRLDLLVLGAGLIAGYFLFHANRIYKELSRELPAAEEVEIG